MRRNTGHSGFTLLEILVALAVLGVTLAAVITAISGYTGNQAYLRDRTLAIWVARNTLVEQQIAREWPGIGRKKGTSELADREWEWVINISQTSDEDLRRLDVEVRLLDTEGDPLALLSGFVWRPPS